MKRRRLLKALGAGTSAAALAATAGCGSDGVERSPDDTGTTEQPTEKPTERPTTEERPNVVRLGEEGLEEGDVVDPYLQEFFNDGMEVYVPPGTYQWNGTGLNASRDAALVGEGNVQFHIDGFELYENINADGGQVVIRNITQTGVVEEGSESRIAASAKDGGTLVLDNFNRPDGQSEDAETTGFYVPIDHSGTVIFRNCTIARCNNGIYASAPGKEDGGEHGRVIVEGGLYRNNNVAAIRLGSDNSIASGVTIVNDDVIPYDVGDEHNGRGIWIRESGKNIQIDSCDIVFTPASDGSTYQIGIEPHNPGSSGTVRNCRLWYGVSDRPIRIDDSEVGSWSGTGIQLQGPGDLTLSGTVEDWIECRGNSCGVPDYWKQWIGDVPNAGN